MARTQRIVVVGLVRDGNGNVLVQQRRQRQATLPDINGLWEFPGGKVDFGEEPAAALRREIREETGCDVVVGRLLPVALSHVRTSMAGDETQYIILSYECWHVGGTPRPASDASDAIRWCGVAEVAALCVMPGVPLIMEAAGLGER